MTVEPHLKSSQAWLTESWQRSISAGLSEFSPAEELRLNGPDLKSKHEKYQQLIDLVQSHAVPLFNQLMAHSNSRLLLADAEGYVLKHWGVSRYSSKLADVALDIGVNWLEKYRGTNAIGTALTSKRAIAVIGDQHFIRQNRFMSCTACPIFSHEGEMLGVLDISSEQHRHSPLTLMLVSSLVQQVEIALLCQLPDSHYRIELAAQPSLLNSGWQGIVIADSDGRIVGCNPMAKQLLSQAKLGDSIEQHLGGSWARLGGFHRDLALHLQTQAIGPMPIKKMATAVDKSQPQLGVRFRDPLLERAWQQANKVLTRQIPLLVLGETGVGKEQFVKKLHAQSTRRAQPLVAVNCAALPAELVESELFGYQAGAFTGAHRSGFIGKIRQAHGGFLFLDEIGEMPLAAQSRLLRVLQEREVVPVGSNQSFKVDIQIIAATHMDLESLVAQGLFRQDLYYRLNGLQVRLPALRERQDIERIIHKLHRKHRSCAQTMCVQLLDLLLHYDWPGNLRELDNLMQVACLMAEGEEVLDLMHLPDYLANKLAKCAAKPTVGINQHVITGSCLQKNESLHSAINQNVLQVFSACEGNVSQCAKRLGISRNALYRRLKQLGIKD
ncbi:sigma-54-dependent Fis family transcriptional regulator [Shewanella acanthi]|uniref:sigma-54-dependent Fis family transcriptional regulator n=1 Tax=Shewanella acanthi TaxID=2864212 RepID=UPI001C6577A9|nr:sigma-54-dependent Fis family transcriptional regulator [Shewanella acanthi]QYJ79058.1 sigma-54-dependent Fis family transcriptional regulator [Shewanella acanthi]